MNKHLIVACLIFSPLTVSAKAWPWPVSSHCQHAYIYKTGVVNVAIAPTKNNLDGTLAYGDLLDLSGKQVMSDIEKAKSDPETIEVYKILGTLKGGDYMRKQTAQCEKNPSSYIPNYDHLKNNGLITKE